jgi:hypothetical protein
MCVFGIPCPVTSFGVEKDQKVKLAAIMPVADEKPAMKRDRVAICAAFS